MRKANIIITVLVILGISALVFGQGRDPAKGIQFGNSYVAGSLDAVNVSNGNVVINLPLASLPKGRGTSPGAQVTLQYNSKIWSSKQTIFSDAIQVGSGDQFPDDSHTYSVDELQQSDTGGWKMLYGYRINFTNRLNLESPNPCLRGDDDRKLSAIWKLEIEFPDGAIRQFVPLNGVSAILDDYYNIDFNGMAYGALRQINPANGLCYMQTGSWQATTNGMNYVATDGSRLRLYVPYVAGAPGGENILQLRNWKIYSPDGTVVENKPADDSTVWQRITDRNGSKVDIKPNQIVDELGRTITISNNSITSFGVNGETLTTQLVWGTRWVYRQYRKIGLLDLGNAPPGTDRFGYVGEQISTVNQIILPTQAGGQSYTFDYYADITQPSGTNYTNGWGELKSVTLPTGAKSTYTYEYTSINPTEISAEDVLQNRANSKSLTYTDENGQPKTETTLYSGSVAGSSVTFPNGAISGEQKFFYYYNPSAWDQGLDYKNTSPDGSFTEKIWQQNLPYMSYNGNSVAVNASGNANAFVKTEFATILDAQGQPYLTAIKDYDYDKNGNLLEVREFDWVPYSSVPRNNGRPTGIPSNAVMKRSTVNEYYNPTPHYYETTVSPNTYDNPASPKLKNVIKASEVRDGDGNLNVVSRTEFYYDDPNNKGNLIETRVWDSYKNGTFQAYSNPLTATNSISTTVQYDQYGNPILSTDAKGTQTQITYGTINGYTGLYPTEVKSAYGTAIEQTSQTEYDFYTGLPKKATALGNTAAENVVSETEYDAIGRPIKTKAAVGTPSEIWSTTEYNDIARRVISRSDIATKGDGKKIAIQHFDQLGRVRLTRQIENVLTEDPYNEADGIKVQTRYETGNPYSYQLTSNPYRTMNDAEMGWTRSKSINTGKHSETETFAGASLPAPWGTNTSSTGKVQTDIDGERTLVTDQAGKQRISKTNALGQLLNVWEVKDADADTEAVTFGSLSLNALKTNYQYDTLNNLITVNQGVQTRSFAYNSLSRLKSANNPESGLINYKYDENGNLTSKTDARNITTTYIYDVLNRVKNRNYSDGTTPNVAYTYDNGTNAKGKLTKVTNGISTTEYTNFDILGRVLSHKQRTDNNDYTTVYTYNLSGALIEEVYPSGRVVKNTLDVDGDLSMVQSSKSNVQGLKLYANAFTYTSAGAVSSLRLGNGKFENTTFNSRLQPIQIGLGSSATSQNLLKLNFDYGGSDNNGNVKSQQITVQQGNPTPLILNQNYVYDSLNRLKSAEEKDVNNATVWKQTYIFDRYGNRNFDATNNNSTNLVGTLPKVTNPEILSSNNRLKADQDGDNVVDYLYDASGNLTKDVDNKRFGYDAENKQVQYFAANNQSTTPNGTYFFDGDGKRVKKISPTETTIFVYNAGGKLVAEYSTQQADIPKINYTTTDNLGSPRITTDANGAVVSRIDYLPYGDEIASTQRTANLGYTVQDSVKQGFTGYIKDDETDLDFAEARMYSKKTGRFNNPDPLLNSGRPFNPKSWNRYSYVLNNPLNMIDPTGLYDCSGTKEQCAQFQAGLDAAQAKANEIKASKKYGANSKEYLDAQRAIDVYGKSTVSNGVTVNFGSLEAGTQGQATGSLDKNGNKSVTVTIDLAQNKDIGNLLLTVAHEGSHAADHAEYQQSLIDAGKVGTEAAVNAALKGVITHGASETRAYGVSSALAEFTVFADKQKPLIDMSSSVSNTISFEEKVTERAITVGGQKIWNTSWASIDKVDKLRDKRSEAIAKGLKNDSRYASKLNQPIEK